MPYLAFNLNDGNEFIFDLVEDRLSLGRNERNEIVIDNSYISSFHAELVRQDDGSYEVSDLKSANGTFINGERIDRSILKMGDGIRFGQLDARLRDAKMPGPESESIVRTTRDNHSEAESAGQVTSKLKTTDRVVQSAIPAPSGNHLEQAIAADLAKLQAEIERKQQAFKVLEALHTAKEQDIADLMETISSQRKELEDSIKKLQGGEQDAKQRLGDLELRQSEHQATLDSKSTLLESLSARHDSLQDSVTQLTREEASLKESIAEQTELAKSLEQTLAPSREELQQTNLALAEARASLETLSQIHADDAAARSSLQEEQAHQESLRQSLAEQIINHQSRYETAIAAAEAAGLKLAERQSDLQTREGAMSTQLEELTQRVNHLRLEEDGLSSSLQVGRERLQKIEAAHAELEKKLAENELAYSQFTHSGGKLVSLSEALSHMETREQEVSRHLQEVAEQELSTQVKINSLDEEIAREQQRLDVVRREREHEEQARSKVMESSAKELEEARQQLTEKMKREESTLARRLKERIQELEEKHETLRTSLSASIDEKTVIIFAGDLIKRIDLVDILIQRFSGSSTNTALEQQLCTLRASLEDILAQHGISEFTVAPGAEVDVDLRLRITIVESIPGPGRPKIIESYRPGFIYGAEDGREIILRKVEVKTSSV